MAYYTRYEKLQKYYKDGTAVVPAEYKKGTNLGVAEYLSINECEIPGDYHWKPVEGKYICEEDSNNKIIINYTLAEGIDNNAVALAVKEHPNDYISYIKYRELKGKETYETTYSIWGVRDVFKTFEFISYGSDLSMYADTDLFNNSQHIEKCTLHLNMPSYITVLTHSFNNCPNLNTLIIKNLNDICSTFIITDCPKLEYIDYGNYPGDVDQYFSGDYLLFKNCPNVKTIKCTSTLKDKAMIEQKDLRNNNNIKWIITDTYE